MNTNRLALSLLPAVILATSAVLLLGASTAYAGKPDKCSPWPACKDDGGDPPPPDPDPGGSADPQLVYFDQGIFLANADGTNKTQISPGGIVAGLDGPGNRVLYLGFGLDLITYDFPDGVINVIQDEVLVSEQDIIDVSTINNATFTRLGVSDWSQLGDKYSYTFREDTPDDAIWRVMVAPNAGLKHAKLPHTLS